jgi:hypothetical protein
MKKLTESERDMLWGETGPYSEAKIVIETRILDDRISRVMIEVRGNINPTTFRIVKNNWDEFQGDEIIKGLIGSAKYRGKKYGYEISTGAIEYDGDKELMKDAKNKLKYTEEALIRMHKFAMEYLGL